MTISANDRDKTWVEPASHSVHRLEKPVPASDPATGQSTASIPAADSDKTVVESVSAHLTSALQDESAARSSAATPSRPAFVRPQPESVRVGEGGRYRIEKHLGGGGMGQVYLASDTKVLDKPVAVKVMTTYSGSDSASLIKRFEQEVAVIAKLKSSHIVKVSDWGLSAQEPPFQGAPFYVMEYLEGQSLGQRLEEVGDLSVESAVRIVLQVCAGLRDAHQAGIVHRDLKPDNIFLIPEGALGEFVKILDFGIAKLVGEENTRYTQLTVAGGFIGTYRYASPEQCRGLAKIDRRSDIYSLGVVLYEMVCGTNPYHLETDQVTEADWIVKHLTTKPQPLRSQDGGRLLPIELEAIVMKCLQKNPAERFATVDELAEALTKVERPFAIATESLQPLIPPLPFPATPSLLDPSSPPHEGETVIESVPFAKETQPTVVEPVSSTSLPTGSFDTESKTEKRHLRASRFNLVQPSTNMVVGAATVIVAVAASGLGLWYYQGMMARQQATRLLGEIETLHAQQQYQQCSTQAESTEVVTATQKAGETLDNQRLALLEQCQVGVATQKANQLLSEIAVLQKQQKHQACYEQAELAAVSSAVQAAGAAAENQKINLLSQCRLAGAQEKAKQSLFVEAIAVASGIPQASPNYQAAVKQLETWSSPVREQAQKVYQQGDLQQAEALVQKIPESTQAGQDARENLEQWKTEHKTNQELIAKAEQALAAKRWQEAKETAQQVNGAYWTQKAAGIISQANIALAPKPVYRPAPQTAVRTRPQQTATQQPSQPVRRPSVAQQPSQPVRRPAVTQPTQPPPEQPSGTSAGYDWPLGN